MHKCVAVVDVLSNLCLSTAHIELHISGKRETRGSTGVNVILSTHVQCLFPILPTYKLIKQQIKTYNGVLNTTIFARLRLA